MQDTSGPALTTDSSNNASAVVLRGADLDALSDNPDDLAADLSALAGPSAGPNGGAIFVDGFSGGQLPPKESIREIRINQNPFSPEYDKLGYGKIEIFTKPGSDKYRGTAQWNFANDFWNTRNPYSPNKAPFLLNEFEGNAGGPLTRKSSFTIDAQRNMVDNGSITNAVTLDPQTLAATTVHRHPHHAGPIHQHQPASGLSARCEQYADVPLRHYAFGRARQRDRRLRPGFARLPFAVHQSDGASGGHSVDRLGGQRDALPVLSQRHAGAGQQPESGDSGVAILQRRRLCPGAHLRYAEQLRTAELQLDAERPALLAIRRAAACANR